NKCFANPDCTDAADRCDVVGMTGDGNPVACCVPGARGTGKTGDMCKNQNDCESGACVYANMTDTFCSKQCTTDMDCPMILPTCVMLDPTVGMGSYCGQILL